MAFYGFHGTDPNESKLGGRFYVDAVLVADLSTAGQSDRLEDTVNYEQVYRIIRDHVEGQRFNLLEALAQKIAVAKVTVRVRKPAVPLKGILDYTQVEVVRQRAA